MDLDDIVGTGFGKGCGWVILRVGPGRGIDTVGSFKEEKKQQQFLSCYIYVR